MNDPVKKITDLPLSLQQITLGALLAKKFLAQDVILTVVGGAAVQFYTQAEYQTKDLDAVLQGDTKEILESVMSETGFTRTTTYRHFENPLLQFWVEFPPCPIQVASRVISKVSTIETSEGPVRIIRIEDLIMDRITAAVEWKDKASLDQAKLLWAKHQRQIDRDYLTDFAKKEGHFKTLQEVMKVG